MSMVTILFWDFCVGGWVGGGLLAAPALTAAGLGSLQREHLPGTDLPSVVFGQDPIFGPNEDESKEPFEER